MNPVLFREFLIAIKAAPDFVSVRLNRIFQTEITSADLLRSVLSGEGEKRWRTLRQSLT